MINNTIKQVRISATEKANEIIFDIDNSYELNQYKLNDGFLLWLQVRYLVFKLLVKRLEISKIESSTVHFQTSKFKSFCHKICYYYLTLLKYNYLFVRKEYEGLVFSSTLGSTNVTSKTNVESRINYFFSKKKKIFNLYFSQNGKYRLPYVTPFSLADSIYVSSVLKQKICNSKMLEEELSRVTGLISFLNAKIGNYLHNDEFEYIQNELIFFYRNYYSVNKTLLSLLRQTKPKFIVVEDANYGGSIMTQILFVANKLNITTIEVQHGILDIAYKYGKTLQEDPFFRDHKTKYLLTYGKYWNHVVDSTTKGFDIGYPYLEEKILKMKSKAKKEILFVSQGSITDSLIDIAIGLSKKLGDSYRIIYRLHPNEIGDTIKYKKFNPYKNISISDSGDIYNLMGICHFVVGSYSAVMFEALLFQKPVFIQKNQYSDEYIPKNMGVRFVDEDELFILLNKKEPIVKQDSISEFWTVGWESRMNQFYKLMYSKETCSK